jgi:carbon starvation protein
LILITLIPLIWLLAVTVSAGWEKIYSPDPRIGFLTQAHALKTKIDQAVVLNDSTALAQADLAKNRTLYFNALLDAGVAATFLLMVLAIVLISLWEWYRLWSKSKPMVLHETPPTWLPEYAVSEGRPVHLAGAAVLAVTLARELSGESQFDRAKEHASACAVASPTPSDAKIYVQVTEQRFSGVRRCC